MSLMVNRNIFYAVLYFLSAAMITSFFIAGKFWLYSDVPTMLSSGVVTVAVWLMQVIIALILLRTEKWEFIKRVGFVSLIGSATLYLYYLFAFLPIAISGFSQFVVSVGCSVIIMIVMYYKAVQKMKLSFSWFWGWMICLTMAIMVQAKFIFDKL